MDYENSSSLCPIVKLDLLYKNDSTPPPSSASQLANGVLRKKRTVGTLVTEVIKSRDLIMQPAGGATWRAKL